MFEFVIICYIVSVVGIIWLYFGTKRANAARRYRYTTSRLAFAALCVLFLIPIAGGIAAVIVVGGYLASYYSSYPEDCSRFVKWLVADIGDKDVDK